MFVASDGWDGAYGLGETGRVWALKPGWNGESHGMRLFVLVEGSACRPGSFQKGVKRGGLGHQVLQGVLAQYCEKGIGRAVQYSSEAAVGQQAARSAMVNACDHTVVLFPDPDDIRKTNGVRCMGQRESSTTSFVGVEISCFAELVHDFHKVIP